MADENVIEKKEWTAEEKAFFQARDQHKTVLDALKNGTLSCLPGADGYADTEPAVNIANGTRYHGASQLYLKEFQKQNGFPTAEYVTLADMRKSEIPIRQGQKGVDISFSAQNRNTGEWENKTVKLFNAAQSVSPAKLKAWSSGEIEADLERKTEYLKSQYGEGYKPQESKKREGNAPEIQPKSSDPEKYLGAYLAAVSAGGKFKSDPECTENFIKKFEETLSQKTQKGYDNPFTLQKVCNAANAECKTVLKEIRAQEIPRARQQEQTQSRPRSA